MSSAERPIYRVWLGFGVAAMAAVVLTVAASRVMGAGDGNERIVVIPDGTAARLAAGEQVNIIPAALQLRLDDRLVVINQDSVLHQVGPFTVAPGGRLERRFAEAATLTGFCSLHPSGEVNINIAGAAS
ncbi:MAG: hypothetical protein ACKV2O_25160 [Acidimicrobiales bacterium]